MTHDLGILGLGEAGRALGGDLVEAGAAVAGYDVAFEDPDRGDALRRRVRDAGIAPLEDPVALASAAETIVSTVVPAAADDAATSVAAHLDPGHLYLDLNSVSPGGKERVRSALEAGAGRFVEGAVMGPVPKHGRRVPILVCGPDAPELVDRLEAYGMRLEVLGPEHGAAAAAKMCRSLVIKGLECLLLECLATAREHRVTDPVLDSVQESIPGIDWRERADYALARLALHAGRRSHEMEEVAETVSAAGFEPEVARAAVRWFRRVAGLDLGRYFEEEATGDFDDVLTALVEATKE